MTTKAEKRTEQAEAITRLREWINPGDTLYTVLRHRAASGMSRSIDVYGFTAEPAEAGRKNARLVKSWYSYNIAKAGIGTWDDKREAIRVSSVGMDMGFRIVYELGSLLFPDGFGCSGEGCQSNDHSNGDHDFTPLVTPSRRCEACLDVPGRNGIGAVCVTCNGTGYIPATVVGLGHWHKAGGYALRQEWIG